MDLDRKFNKSRGRGHSLSGFGSRTGGDWMYEYQDSESNLFSYAVNQMGKPPREQSKQEYAPHIEWWGVSNTLESKAGMPPPDHHSVTQMHCQTGERLEPTAQWPLTEKGKEELITGRAQQRNSRVVLETDVYITHPSFHSAICKTEPSRA